MTRRILITAAFAVLVPLQIGLASAQQGGTAAEAKAMLANVVTLLKSNEVTALAAFNDKSNKQFHDRDLYPFCFSTKDGKYLAHPNPALMGTDIRAVKFKDDPLGQRIFDAVTHAPPETVSTLDHYFPKPGTTEFVAKQSFVTRVGDVGCGVGYYK
jgi:hypothetical protein